MTELQRLENAFRKADALAQQGDQQAAQDARMFAGEIRKLQAAPQPEVRNQNGFLGQANAGIANTVGGLVDFINPFDNEVWQDTPLGTGSAREALTSGMRSIGADVATEEPQNVVQAMGRGTGEAAAALVPVVKGLQALRSMGGAVGAFADDAVRALSTWGGVTTEAAAGAISRGAEQGAEEAGAPEWVQNTAAVLAPMSIPAGAALVRPAAGMAANMAERLPLTGPLVGAARRMPGQVAAAVAPYTERGARRIAGDRMVELAGGRERADELASMTTGENPLNLTPAQMTNDQNMLALEQTAAGEDAALRARLEDRAGKATATARSQISNMGGDVEAAQRFFEGNRRRFVSEMTRKADEIVQKATGGVQGINAERLTSENSNRVMQAVEIELKDRLLEERRLWDAVDKGVPMSAGSARAVAQEFKDTTPWAQKEDIPPQVLRLLEEDEVQTVNELHGLYSKLRQVARTAMAGTNQNKNMARIANTVADAILEDLGAVDGSTAVGRKINEARAYSAALHETFDQGQVGRLLNRTIDGDTTIAPEVALDRSVARPGAAGMVADRDIAAATNGKAAPFVADFLKGRFNERAFNANGEFTSLGANSFLRDNAELLRRYPELRAEIQGAVNTRITAEQLATRITARLDTLRSERRSAAERFLNGAPDQAFLSILRDKNPAQAAARLANEARKDPSGQALAGLKGAVSEYLVANAFRVSGGQVQGNADAIQNILQNPRQMQALRRIFSNEEMNRLERLARDMGRLQEAQRAQPSIGGLVDSRANRLVEYLARVVAARQGAQLGGGFAGGMQSAQMASSRMKEALGYLVSDKASQMLADAIEDPELFRALLTEITPQNEARILNKAWPYLIGTVTTGDGE